MTRTSNQELGLNWEKDVHDFFEKLGFEVAGGPNFKPGGMQVDCVAGSNNALFIIECKTKHDYEESSKLTGQIRNFRVKCTKIAEAFREGYNGGKYKKYGYFIPLIATKDVIWTEGDERTLRIRIEDALPARNFTKDALDYYYKIADDVSEEISRVTLLADYGADRVPPNQQNVEVPAFLTVVNGLKVYSFIVAPQKIIPRVGVARRESSFHSKLTFQRIVDGARCQAIMDYIESKDKVFPKGMVIPGNLILATDADSSVEFKETKNHENHSSPNFKQGILRLPDKYGAMWVVDGQHRLYAYAKSPISNLTRGAKGDLVLVTLLDGFTREQQSRIFVDINDLQKSVDLSYLIDIEGETNESSEMGIISNTIKKLDQLTLDGEHGLENVFFGNIKIPSRGIGRKKYSMKGTYQAIKRFKLIKKKTISANHENNPYAKFGVKDNPQHIAEGIAVFFSAAKKILGDDIKGSQYNLTNLLLRSRKDGVIDVLLGVYERILAARASLKSLTPDEIQDYLKPVAEKLKAIDTEAEFEAFFSTAGHGPRNDTIRRICVVIRDSGKKNFEFPDLDQEINEIANRSCELENRLRELLNIQMVDAFGHDWCKGKNTQAFPGTIFNLAYASAKEDIARNRSFTDHGRLYTKLDFGQVRDLILRHWQGVFEEIMVHGHSRFRDKQQFQEAMKHLIEYRKARGHGNLNEKEKDILRQPEQQAQARIFLTIFDRILADTEESQISFDDQMQIEGE